MDPSASTPEAKFREGDAVVINTGKESVILTIVDVGEYHTEFRDRCYLARFPDNTLNSVWERDITSVKEPKIKGEKRYWQIMALWAQYRKIIDKSRSVRQWSEKEQSKLNDLLMTTTAGGMWPAGVVLFLFGLVTSVITLMVVSGGGNPSRTWPPIGWFFIASGVGGLATWIKLGIPASRRTEALREEKQKEYRQDPLWQRAELIVKAVSEFEIHHNHFYAWQTAVDENLQDGDETLAERYHAFLTRASVGINGSIDNFMRAAELTARQTEYNNKHPELAQRAASTHLSDLMAQLNCPVEIPAAISLMDPRKALDHEESLAEAVGELYEGELARQIDEALQAGNAPMSDAVTSKG